MPAVEWECAVIRSRPSVSGKGGGSQGVRGARSLSLRLEEFAWESLEQESARLSVSVEDLIAFSIQYYLADLDSGRIARRITRSPYPDATAPP